MATERRIGVAVDFSKGSKQALTWAIDNLLREGDHLVLITIQPEGIMKEERCSSGKPLVLVSFIPLAEFSDPHNMKRYQVTPDAETLDIVNTAAKQKEIDVLMKIFWGDPREKICEAIDNIPLSCIVIGNRGLGTIKRTIMGSVSNYVVNHASCPVTVVKTHN